jgi:p-cumate 2,3-dioxygenase alpha subunit
MKLGHIDPAKRRFRVHRDACRSQEVFDGEKERMFATCWLHLRHNTELPNKGDFLTRTVIGRDLIFVRSRDGEIGAFVNSSTHRGARVCRDKSGNTKSFAYPYNGSVFNTEGEPLSMNAQRGLQAEINADGPLSSLRVPRLENYCGFYFVNYNANAISRADYPADAKGFIDLMCDQGEGGGITIMPSEHLYAINANYKLMGESSYDGYHLLTTRISDLEFLEDQSKLAGKESAVNFLVTQHAKQGRNMGLGHGYGGLESWVTSGRPVAQWVPASDPDIKQEIDTTGARLEKADGKEQAGLIADEQKNMIVLPPLVINDDVGSTMRVIEPMSANSMRINAWPFAPGKESPRMRALRPDNFVGFLNPAGFGFADDVEVLELCQRGLDHAPVEWSELSQGFATDGDSRQEAALFHDEAQMRAYPAHWDRMMQGLSAFDSPTTAPAVAPTTETAEREEFVITDALLSRAAVDNLQYGKGGLLDDWRLPEWADLYTDDAHYDIAPLDLLDPPKADPDMSPFVLSDARFRIVSSAKRLMKRTAHAEYPHSKTPCLTGNIRLSACSGSDLAVRANFAVYRTKGDNTVQYMGEAHYVLAVIEGKIRIRRKRCVFDLNTLAHQGRLTIIL